MCTHEPRCPAATASGCLAAHVCSSHPEQGWNLLCNGVVLFDDGGALLPTGEAVAPPPMWVDANTRRLVGAGMAA